LQSKKEEREGEKGTPYRGEAIHVTQKENCDLTKVFGGGDILSEDLLE